jgi:hypothetical protein
MIFFRQKLLGRELTVVVGGEDSNSVIVDWVGSVSGVTVGPLADVDADSARIDVLFVVAEILLTLSGRAEVVGAKTSITPALELNAASVGTFGEDTAADSEELAMSRLVAAGVLDATVKLTKSRGNDGDVVASLDTCEEESRASANAEDSGLNGEGTWLRDVLVTAQSDHETVRGVDEAAVEVPLLLADVDPVLDIVAATGRTRVVRVVRDGETEDALLQVPYPCWQASDRQ